MYHQVTAYDHGIAYARFDFSVVDMEVVFNYLADRKLRHSKRQFDVMHRAAQPCVCTIFYFIIPHLAFIVFIVSYLYRAVGV